jgi:hypothetical protein
VSDERGRFRHFVENFGKVPEEEPTPLIPEEYRVPVYLGMALVSLVLLALLLWLVVFPAIRSQQAPAPHSEAPARSLSASA